jgi:hypothetical protein
MMIKNELSNVLFIAKEAIVLQRSEFLQLPALHNIPLPPPLTTKLAGRNLTVCRVQNWPVQSPEMEFLNGIFSRGF